MLDTLAFTELFSNVKVVKMLIFVNWCLQMCLKGEFRLNVGNGPFSITTLANADCFEIFDEVVIFNSSG